MLCLDQVVSAGTGRGLPTPQELRPFPKARPRKVDAVRRKRKTAILTDTPVKRDLEEQKANTKKRLFEKSEKQQSKSPAPKKSRKRRSKSDDDDEDEDGYFCLVCVESYIKRRPGEVWIQCQYCKQWAHSVIFQPSSARTATHD
ncbi:hypothetical protein AAFF_G00181340 [Aldrovandia affinis]|uniref:Uncharacterized protein n=1 Tax=Aldrovandia affinis TaxID=143900 RepID=A0AAD7SYF7_9TELE|nr:hypothetical protein AAFF_G00181340 [Aldrovandia affinis]